MSKEVATISAAGAGLLAAFAQGSNPFLDAAGDTGEFFGKFLKFNGNTGKFTYGEDEDEVDAGSVLLVNMETAQHGWICWVDGQVEDEKNFVIAEGKPFPSESELPDHGPYTKHDDGSEDGWSEQYILHLYSEDLEEAFTFKVSSGSGVRAIRKFLKAYGSKAPMQIGEDGNIKVPLIEVEVDSFKLKNNPKAGKKYAPVLQIVEWVERAEVADLFAVDGAGGDDPDDYEDEGEAPAPEPAKEASKPRRNARGSAKAEELPVIDQDGEGNTVEEEPEEKPVTTSRRARVVHAKPQDAEEAPEPAETRRQSARARRAR